MISRRPKKSNKYIYVPAAYRPPLKPGRQTPKAHIMFLNLPKFELIGAKLLILEPSPVSWLLSHTPQEGNVFLFGEGLFPSGTVVCVCSLVAARYHSQSPHSFGQRGMNALTHLPSSRDTLFQLARLGGISF